MTKLIYSLALCFFTLPALSQVQPGAVYTGAHLSGSIKRNDSFSKTKTFNFEPTAGYFISSNWMLGAHAQVSISKSESDQVIMPPVSSGYTSFYRTTWGAKTTSYSFGPVARYYTPLGNKFAFFLEGKAGYTYSKYDYSSESSLQQAPGTGMPTTGGQPAGSPWGTPTIGTIHSSNYNNSRQESIYSTLAPGVAFFPTSKLGIEVKSNVLSYSNQNKGEFDANFNLAKMSLGAGFYW